jgi:tetratricopeptide (TPR) repeat protein
MMVAVLLAALRAQAADSITDDQAARRHYDAGKAYFDRAAWAEALHEFEESYHLASYPAILYNIGLCHERLGHTKEAIDTLKRYLALDRESPRRQSVEQLIANLEQRAATTPLPLGAMPSREADRRRPLIIGLSVGGAALVVGLAVGLGLAFGLPPSGTSGPLGAYQATP